MSVLKYKRNTSLSEFEENFSRFYKYSTDKLNSASKRRIKFIVDPFTVALNELYDSIMDIENLLFAKKPDKKEAKQLAIQKSFKLIFEVEKRMMIFSNIRDLEFDKQANWASQLNTEIDLLNSMVDSEHPKCEDKLMILDWKAINKFDLTKIMSYYHKFIHGKATRAVGQLSNSDTPHLIALVDEAFYYVMRGNKIYPRTLEELKEREVCFERAYDAIYKMQRPIMSFINTMEYSNKVQREFAQPLYKLMRIIKGVQKADKNNFKHLIN